MPGIPKNYTFHDCRLIQITAGKSTAPKFYYGNEVTLLIRDDEREPIETALLEYERRWTCAATAIIIGGAALGAPRSPTCPPRRRIIDGSPSSS
jgi:hypothetical protein